ncbi:MAG: hypothetical protein ACREOO_09775 [bacterium]
MISYKRRIALVALGLVLLFALASAQVPEFGGCLDLGLIELEAISEASGMAASQKNQGVLWVHNDSGDTNRVFAFNASGEHLGIFMISGASARDWEDMALGPGPEEGKDYLYIGDIGDNGGQHDFKYIYRVPEPIVEANQSPVELTLDGAAIITFQYPDGKRDAETLMIDPRTNDLYVVSKREANVRVYRATFPQSTSETIMLEHVTNLPFGGAVAGDISRAGDEILIKTYDAVYYWKRGPEQSMAQALSQAPARVPYVTEPQGEAVCWHPEGRGYYTMSEEFQNIPSRLYFYTRLNSTEVLNK